MAGQTLQKAFVTLPGGGAAVYTSTGLAYYRHSDWLGSSRLASTPSRTMYYDAAYAPYGENYAASGTTDLNYTGQNQDTVAGLHDFLFREYHPNQGRWISPDPAGTGAVDPTNPQTWNRYGYVANNPQSHVDGLGLLMDLVSPFEGGGGDNFGDDCLTCGAGLNPGLGPGQVLMDGNPVSGSLAQLVLNMGAGNGGLWAQDRHSRPLIATEIRMEAIVLF
jgi:RHS repeat-associated protein